MRAWSMLILGMILSACTAAPSKAPIAVANPTGVSLAQAGASNETGELDRRAKQMGYHVEIRNHERLYCQHAAPVGTHIATNHCLNAELMAQAARDDEEIKDKLSQRGNKLCPSCIQK
jgi:hypothetical protein